MSGYSARPLQAKLGISSSISVLFINAPDEYFSELGELPMFAKVAHEKADFIHAFFVQKDELIQQAEQLANCLQKGGMLWLSWPKKSAHKILQSDITEQDLRDIFLPLGVVDVKVCSVTEVWSGLKFMWRKGLGN